MSARLIEVKKIWDQAAHNALTDLVRYRNLWFCAFREGEDHVSPEGKIRILISEDAFVWNSGSLISIPEVDLRDPKITVTPSGGLMLNAGGAYGPASPFRHQSFVWFSWDGMDWSAPEMIGDPNFWLWRVTWNRDIAYGIAYSTVEPSGIRLYSSSDGVKYDVVANRLFVDGSPNEATIVFRKDNTALCLLRRDAGKASAMLGRSKPGYEHWDWKDLGVRVGGPNLLVLPDGRIIAAIRRYGQQPWTSLSWLDPAQSLLTEFLALPSGGDTSYAGLQWYEGILWVSYYSSHEERTSIYLAKVDLS
jgi:hypothetical protein